MIMKIKHVACALLIKNGKLLLQERKGISKYGEQWSFFWGSLEEWESSYDALLREMNEELWFSIESWNIGYHGEIIHEIKWHDIEYHRYLYLIDIPDSITEFEDREWSGAYFFNISEISKLKFNTDISKEINILEQLLNIK